MNSSEIMDYIETISKDASKNAKETLIRAHDEDVEFLAVLTAGVSDFVTYGMQDVPIRSDSSASEGRDFNKATWNLLDALSSRGLTGNEAKFCVFTELNQLNAKSAELLTRIIKKDLRAGFSSSTVNKAIPGLVPTFDCMLAHKFEEKRIKEWPQIAEPKLDGVRVLTFVDATLNVCRFYSRSGKEFLTFEHLKPYAIALAAHMKGHQVVFDSEVMSGEFNKTVGDVRRKDAQATDAVLYVFDVLSMSTFNREDKNGSAADGSYLERRKKLVDLFGHHDKNAPIRLNERYLVNSFDEIYTIYENCRNKGLEGLIIKDPKGLYHRRRNHAWMKIKAADSVDIIVTGTQEGTGKAAGSLGALVCDFNGVSVNVGSGLSDDQRASFWANKDQLLGRIVEVLYHEITPDKSLRHPRFVRFRDTLEHGVKE